MQKLPVLTFDILFTPLDYASIEGHYNIVEYLIQHGADFHGRINGQRYLHWAAQKGLLGVIEYLVNHKEDVNSKNNSNEFLHLVGLLFT